MRTAETVPTPASEPAPAAAAPEPTPDPDDDEHEVVDGKVPYGVVKSERKKRQEAQKEAADLRAAMAKGEGRLETLEKLIKAEQQRASQRPGEPIQIPDVNVDPIGHFRAENEVLKQQLSEIGQWRNQQEQQANVQTNVSRISQIASGHEAEFKKITPDYDDASNYLRSMEDARLQTMGVSDPAARAQAINNSALQIALTALNSGKNAAETVYALAKASGYQPKGKAAPAKTQDAQKIEMAAQGQKQAGGIGAVNGTAPAKGSLQALADMSEDEFAKATEGGNWKKLMESLPRT